MEPPQTCAMMAGSFKCDSRHQRKFFKWNQLCISSMSYLCFNIYYYTLNYYDATFFINPDKTWFFCVYARVCVCVCLYNSRPITWKKNFHWTFTWMQLCGQIYTQTPSHRLQPSTQQWWSQGSKMAYHHPQRPYISYCRLKKKKKKANTKEV